MIVQLIARIVRAIADALDPDFDVDWNDAEPFYTIDVRPRGCKR